MIRHYLATLKHKWHVFRFLFAFSCRLIWRGLVHDLSKFGPEEAPHFAKALPELNELTYGSEEYDEALDDLRPALRHHYEVNRHHPEHFEHPDFVGAPIRAMHLVDLVEMFCDWRAAVRRHDDGNICESVRTNAERYGFEDDLLHTILFLEAWRVRDGYEYEPRDREDSDE